MGKGFKIPKPPGRGSCSSFAMFTREKCKEIQEGTVEEPELEGLTDFVERSKVLAEIWKTMSSEEKHEFEEMRVR